MFTSFEVITFYCSVFKDQLRLYNTVLWRLDYNNRFTDLCQQLFLIFFYSLFRVSSSCFREHFYKYILFLHKMQPLFFLF